MKITGWEDTLAFRSSILSLPSCPPSCSYRASYLPFGWYYNAPFFSLTLINDSLAKYIYACVKTGIYFLPRIIPSLDSRIRFSQRKKVRSKLRDINKYVEITFVFSRKRCNMIINSLVIEIKFLFKFFKLKQKECQEVCN